MKRHFACQSIRALRTENEISKELAYAAEKFRNIKAIEEIYDAGTQQEVGDVESTRTKDTNVNRRMGLGKTDDRRRDEEIRIRTQCTHVNQSQMVSSTLMRTPKLTMRNDGGFDKDEQIDTVVEDYSDSATTGGSRNSRSMFTGNPKYAASREWEQNCGDGGNIQIIHKKSNAPAESRVECDKDVCKVDHTLETTNEIERDTVSLGMMSEVESREPRTEKNEDIDAFVGKGKINECMSGNGVEAQRSRTTTESRTTATISIAETHQEDELNTVVEEIMETIIVKISKC